VGDTFGDSESPSLIARRSSEPATSGDLLITNPGPQPAQRDQENPLEQSGEPSA
jgi:hypothetical protein